MKLKYLIEDKVKLIDRKIPLDITSSDNINLSMLGKGQFAKVYRSNIDNNKVIKIAIVDSPYDPTIQYIEHVMNNQDNPHLPRISSAKVYPTDGEKYILVVIMEKLFPLTNKKIFHMLPTFMRQLGISDEEMKQELRTSKYLDDDFNESIDLNDLSEQQLYLLGEFLFYIFSEPKNMIKYARKTKNKKISEALVMLHYITSKNINTFPDIHEKNIMIRLGNPPQLVITDPLAYLPDHAIKSTIY